jgi:superfamily I DNA/RNA helicase
MAQSSQYDEVAYPSKITPHGGLDLIAQVALMATQIGDQLIAYPDDLIGVLCPRNEDLDVVAQELAKAGLDSHITRANSDDFDPSRPIWLSTISSAKGLEFRVLHIAGLEALKRMGPSQKRLIYTGVTRAKTALTLYWNESIPGYLDAAIKTVMPSSHVVTKKNIFGKV